MQGTQQHYSHVSLKRESVWFKTKLISQFLSISFLLTQPFYLSYLHAAPVGGNVVGGSGSISSSDIHTTINQSSQNLAIDWQSFDVNTNEHVHFVQPNSSSIALNRILGNNGSVIQGQIDANGQVILVNPNGVFFTSTATVNVGGLVASSLDMTPADFMNGNYIFNEVIGSNGSVINSGLIQASLGGANSNGGGNVVLIGKQVKNDGLIFAKLGSVVLAAGKQSVLTFDNQGLIGVKVTKEVLQDEIGLEEAVINAGNINAAGGRVLLTASTSQDVFSQAVNNGTFNQATSVVVNPDGSFTLGGGADVLNTGSIDVSSADLNISNNTARIILLGENITSSGSIKADVQNGTAGEIEIHAKNKTLLTKNSITSAKALSSGQGGLIKILGDKVGLFDNTLVDVSGINDGGVALIGGDQEGRNTQIRNANFIFLGDETVVKADAITDGRGGKIIAFAKDSARIYGGLFARGGLTKGNGGFIETSGLKGFDLIGAPDASAFVGKNGTWLIDPYNITISSSSTQGVNDDDPTFSYFDAIQNGARIDVSDIVTGLENGDVIIRTTRTDGDPSVGIQAGNITLDAEIDFNGIGRSSTLTLKADNNIDTNGNNIRDTNIGSGNDLLNIVFTADSDNSGVGNVIVTDSRIYTNGGSFTARGVDFTLTGTGNDYIWTKDRSSTFNYGDVNLYMSGDVLLNTGSKIVTNGGNINIAYIDIANSANNIIPTSFVSNGTLNSTGGENRVGGKINVTTSGIINVTSTGQLNTNGGQANRNAGLNGGDITLSAGGLVTIDSTQNISTVGSQADHNGNTDDGLGGVGGKLTINSSAANVTITSNILTRGGNGDGDNNHAGVGGVGGDVDISSDTGSVSVSGIIVSGGDGSGNNSGANGGNAGQVLLTASTNVLLDSDLSAKGGRRGNSNATDGFGNTITINGNTIINNTLSIDATSQSTNGDLIFNGSIAAANVRTQDLTLKGKDITIAGNVGTSSSRLNNVSITSTGVVKAETSGPVTAKDFFVNTLNVTQSSNFTAGLIDASAAVGTSTDNSLPGSNTVIIRSLNAINVGDVLANGGTAPDESAGFDGGGILLAANDITAATINSSGSKALSTLFADLNGGNAGNISLTSTGTLADNTPTITINGDMNASGGTGTGTLGQSGTNGTVDLTLVANNASNVASKITLNYISNFTSLINITGSARADTLQATNRINAWQLTGLNSGNLNTNTLLNPTVGVTFSGIETITGGTTNNDTLTASTGDNVWTVDGNGTGTVTGLTRFNNINNLVGNKGKDDFTLSGKITGSIDGVANTIAADANTISAQTGSNLRWSIDTSNGGTEDNLLLIGGRFSNIHQITGGSGNDDFTITSTGSIRDFIDGGAQRTAAGDTLDMSAVPTSIEIVLGSTVTSVLTDLNISNIETITGNNDGSKSLIASTLSVESGNNNTWNVTAANSGDVTNSNGTVNFINFTDLNGSDSLSGNGGNDRFIIASGGSISGLVDARGQDTNTTPFGRDILDLSNMGSVTLDIATVSSSTKYINFEEYAGNNTGANISTVVGENAASTWTVDGIDSGFVTNDATTKTIYFSGFNYLTGGNQADNFIVTGTGAISGLIDGGITSTNDRITVVTPGSMVNLALGKAGINTATNIYNIDRIDGDGTNVTLLGENMPLTTWNITGSNTGNVNYSSGSVNFFNVNNLTGNLGKDVFNFDNGILNTSSLASSVRMTGLIDGGDPTTLLSGGGDVVDMSQIVGAYTVTLESNIIGIESVIGNNTAATLEGATVLTNWDVTGTNSGAVSYTTGQANTVNFSGFNNLKGQDNVDDIFKITTGSISGSIDGGGGTGIDSVDYSLSSQTRVEVGNSSNGIGGIEQVIGSSSITLVGVQTAGITNTWLIDNDAINALKDGNNDGLVTYDIGGGAETLSFVNFGSLEAGVAGDTFTINAGGSFNGKITGGAGNDSLNVTLSGAQLGALTFDGISGNNSLTLSGDSGNGGTDYSGVYTAKDSALTNDKFIYTNSANNSVFSIEYSNTGTGIITDNLIASNLTVNGSANNDLIILDTNTFKVNASPVVTYSGKTNFSVNGLGGVSDSIRIDGALTFNAGVLTLNAENLTTPATTFPVITAKELVLDSVAMTGSSAAKKLNTNITNLSVINSGSLYLENLNGLNIAELNNSSLLDIVALTGDITGIDRNISTLNADLISSGALSLNAANGNIFLEGNNQLSGRISLVTSTAADIRLNNVVQTRFDTVSTRNLTVTSNGTNAGISQFNNQSTITSAGLTSLSSSGNIMLANAANDFTTLSVGGAQNLRINDTNTIGLNSLNASSVEISVVDDITDANGNAPGDNITASTLKLRAGTGIGNGNALETNVSNIDAITTAGNINIDNIGVVELSNLTVTNSGNITFNNTGDVIINKIDAGFGTRNPTPVAPSGGGNFTMTVIAGSVTGSTRSNYRSVADITSYNANILVPSGTFGSAARGISVKVNNDFNLFSLQSAVFYVGQPQNKNDTSTAKIAITDAFSSLAGQQLIEIESIGDIDPAIFTDVRNYSHSDIALMMPSDQRYDISDEEEDEEVKQEREKFLKSNL